MPTLTLPFADHPRLQTLAALALLLGVVWLVLAIGRRLIVSALRALVRRSPGEWDDILLSHRAPERFAMLLPIVVTQGGLPLVPGLSEGLVSLLTRGLSTAVILVAALVFSALLAGVHDLYQRTAGSGARPIKSYIQLAQVFIYLVAGVFIVSQLTNQTPWYLISGLGAVMAIILLIFRDTLLSLVASIQLTNNDLVRVGDWIEMPQFGADGDVIDIALHTVKVQNWDKTITVIPTHRFLDNSFRNWRGMFDGGGRRIKRAIYINMASIRFLDDDDLDRFAQFVLLHPYIAQKRADLAASRAAQAAGDATVAVNARRLTNIGTLRAYVAAYLRQHPQIHQEMTFLVRQLAPTAEGLPLEIYVFTNDTRWAAYEGIQADIFDHILAMVPAFDLQVYQRPSGQDLHLGAQVDDAAG